MKVVEKNGEERAVRYVEFDFENAKASALERIATLQEGVNVLSPSKAGEVFSQFVTRWSFELDPKDPKSYGELTAGDYKYVMSRFFAAFRDFFSDAAGN